MTAKKNFIAIRLCLSFVALLAATNDILNNLTINLWVSMEGKVAKLEEVMDALNGNPEERKKLHADPVSYLQSKGVVLKGVTNNQVVARAKRMENVQTEWGYDAIVTPNEEETKQK